MKFYRYETGNIRNYNGEFLNVPFLKADLLLRVFLLKKETPKGYWITEQEKNNNIFSLQMKPKWIPKISKKRFAYPTKEEALKSRIAINKRRIKFLKGDLEIAEQVKNQCEKLLKDYEKK